MCVPVAAGSVWLYYEKTFEGALKTVAVFLFVAFAFVMAQGGSRR
jgi:hypothetical protein